MSNGEEHILTLYKWKDIYAFSIYTSLISQNFSKTSKKKKGNPLDARWIYNFKKYFKESEKFSIIVKTIQKHFQADEIIAIPASTTEPNSIQKLFGTKIRKLKNTDPRKYNHSAPISPEYSESYSLSGSILGPTILLIDDICTTGKTINHFAEKLEQQGFKVIKLALAFDYKLEPQEYMKLPVFFPEVVPEPDQKQTKNNTETVQEKDTKEKPLNKYPSLKHIKLDQKIISRFIRGIEQGMTYKAAAKYSRMAKSTYYNYMNMAKEAEKKALKNQELTDEEQLCLDFLDLLEEANANLQFEVLGYWKENMKESGVACENFMKRRFKGEWGDKVEIEKEDDGTIHSLVDLLKSLRGEYLQDINKREDWEDGY